MTDFVYDNTNLNFPKSDLQSLPPAADPTKYMMSGDWNVANQAIIDLRNAVLNGKWHGLQDNPSEVAATAGVKVRSKGGRFQVSESFGLPASSGSTPFGSPWPYFNVMDYGADPKGLVDSGPAFDAAFTAMNNDWQQANGGSIHGETGGPIGLGTLRTLFVPRGVYLIATPFTLPSYVRVVGEQSILVGADYSTDIMLVSQTYRQHIDGLQFIGGRDQVHVLAHLDDIRFTNCTFSHPGRMSYNNSDWQIKPAWNGASVYHAGDVVLYLGLTYVATATHNADNINPATLNGWQLHPLIGTSRHYFEDCDFLGAFQPFAYWAGGNTYAIGDKVIFKKLPYIATAPHVADNVQPDTLTGWSVYSGTDAEKITGQCINSFGSDNLIMRRCFVFTSMAVPMTLSEGDYRFEDTMMVNGGVYEWFEVNNSSLSIHNCKITGEQGSGGLFEYTQTDSPGDGFYAQSVGLGVINITDSVVFASLLRFYNIPQTMKIRGNTGLIGGFWFGPNITQLQLELADIATGWDVDFKGIDRGSIGLIESNLGPDTNIQITNEVFHRMGVSQAAEVVPSDDFLGNINITNGVPVGEAIYPSGGVGNSNCSAVLTTDPVTGWAEEVITAPNAPTFGNFTDGLYGGLLNALAGPGLYTLSLMFEIRTDTSMTVAGNAGKTEIWKQFSKGRHVLNIPFSWRGLPKNWQPFTSYAVGDFVMTDGPYVPSGLNSGFICVAAGQSGPGPNTTNWTSASPTNAGTFGNEWNDGTVKWVIFWYAEPGIAVYNIPPTTVFGLVHARLFKGNYGGKSWDLTTYGSNAPTRGNWRVGDKVINTQPGIGLPSGWICTTGGSIGPAWATGTQYNVGDIVKNDTRYWICVEKSGAGTSAGAGPGPNGAIFPRGTWSTSEYFVDNPGANELHWMTYSDGADAVFRPYGLIG